MRKKIVLSAILICVVIVALIHTTKPLPQDITYEGNLYPLDYEILIDSTYIDNSGQYTSEQEIFDTVLDTIQANEGTIVVDMFLFNEYMGSSDEEPFRPLTQELTQSLIEATANNDVYMITDHINTQYQSTQSPHLTQLQNAGIPVIFTNTHRLRDSNIIYSPLFRIVLQWIPHSIISTLPSVFDKDEMMTLQGYTTLFNAKANHRKVLIADNNVRPSAMILSANPHDGSSRHANVAVKVNGPIVDDLLKSEAAVAQMSGTTIPYTEPLVFETENTYMQVLTNQKIKERLLEDLAATSAGDTIDLGMFYFSDRDIINAIVKASNKGVEVKIILDPNKDAFGREKNGIPNRQVATEILQRSNAQLRWYDTNGEQFHSKFIIITKDNQKIVYLGSANFTRRNLNDLNLETNIKIVSDQYDPQIIKLQTYFDTIFVNEINQYTLDYEAYKDTSILKYIMYMIQELFGVSTF